MSRQSNLGRSHKIDLSLRLAQPAKGNTSRTATEDDFQEGSSSPNSCLSSETEQPSQFRNSCEVETSPMVLAACPRCLMYVMLSEHDPKCPKCNSAALLNFLHIKH